MSSSEYHIPFLLLPGWGDGFSVYKDFAHHVAVLTGRTVLGIDYDPKYRSTEKGTFPPSQMEKAEQIINLLYRLDIPQVDVLAYSEGALNALAATTLKPSRFRHFYFIAPGGLLPPLSYPSIMLSGIRNGLQTARMKGWWQEDAKQRLRIHEEAVKKWVQGRGRLVAPILGMDPGRYDGLRQLLLMENRGHQFKIVCFEKDVMVPYRPLQERLTPYRIPITVTPNEPHAGMHHVPQTVARVLFA